MPEPKSNPTTKCVCTHTRKEHSLQLKCKRCKCEFFSPVNGETKAKGTDAAKEAVQPPLLEMPSRNSVRICFFELMSQDQPMVYSGFTVKGRRDDKHAKISIDLPMNAKSANFTRLPKSFGETHRTMQENPELTEVKVEHVLNNMTIEFFIAPDTTKPAVTINAATIDKFVLWREKQKRQLGKKKQLPPSAAQLVTLSFEVSCDYRNEADFKNFILDSIGYHVWWKAEPGQKELPLKIDKVEKPKITDKPSSPLVV